jgi:hypothetical protein
VAPIAPAGLDMARWFTVVERDPLLRSLLSLPTPLPEVAVRTVVGRVYSVLALADQQLEATERVVELLAGFPSGRYARAA